MKVKTSKGFTLAELLIVMAIIVVLAAIAIPTFGKQLETARETADEQMLRSALTDAFSLAYVDYANGKEFKHAQTITNTGYTASSATGVTYGAYPVEIESGSVSQAVDGFDYISPTFKVDVNGSSVPLTESAKVGTGTNAANYVVFEFAAGGDDAPEAITLTKVVTIKS